MSCSSCGKSRTSSSSKRPGPTRTGNNIFNFGPYGAKAAARALSGGRTPSTNLRTTKKR